MKGKLMKAITYKKYGAPQVLKLRDVERPVPKEDEVLIRVRATAVTSRDWRLRAAAFPGVFWLLGRMHTGLFRPRRKILGSDLAGEIVAVGDRVSRFKPGDRVFGYSSFGAYAEYVTMPADGALAPMPANLSYEAAAAIPFGGLTALNFLRDRADVREGQNVLINGASGCVGTFAVQLAKHFGARVTGVCSAANRHLVASLGADRVIDYETEDFAAGSETYDIIFDTVGTTKFAKCRRVLAPTGMHLFLCFGVTELIQALWTARRDGPKAVCGIAQDNREDLATLGRLVASGAIKPFIDRRYTLAHTAEAHFYVEQRHKRGSVVVAV